LPREASADPDFISRYARRRGARDPDGIAAEAMAIAWRRLADVPTADARPWLIVTARNLLLAERRSEPETGRQPLGDIDLELVATTVRPGPHRVVFHYAGFRGYALLFAISAATLLALLCAGLARARRG
jgi:DNA-directed RNA polymerase specialized sigma24 family protein